MLLEFPEPPAHRAYRERLVQQGPLGTLYQAAMDELAAMDSREQMELLELRAQAEHLVLQVPPESREQPVSPVLSGRLEYLAQLAQRGCQVLRALPESLVRQAPRESLAQLAQRVSQAQRDHLEYLELLEHLASVVRQVQQESAVRLVPPVSRAPQDPKE